MSWSTYRARRAVLEEVLTRAQVDLDSALRFDEIPGAIELFGTRENVLLALQQRWNTHLAARLDQALEDGTSPDAARLRLGDDLPALRAVLDAGTRASLSLRRARYHEHVVIDSHRSAAAAPPVVSRPGLTAASDAPGRTATLWASSYSFL